MAITKHYIDTAFVEPHGGKVMESINPTNQQVLGSVMLGDAEDAKRAIAATRAFPTYSRTTKTDRSEILRRMHDVTSARKRHLMIASLRFTAWPCIQSWPSCMERRVMSSK